MANSTVKVQQLKEEDIRKIERVTKPTEKAVALPASRKREDEEDWEKIDRENIRKDKEEKAKKAEEKELRKSERSKTLTDKAQQLKDENDKKEMAKIDKWNSTDVYQDGEIIANNIR